MIIYIYKKFKLKLYKIIIILLIHRKKIKNFGQNTKRLLPS